MVITNLPNLADLEALDGVEEVGGSLVLTQLGIRTADLRSLTTVGDQLVVQNHEYLDTVGFDQLVTVQSISVEGVNSLVELDGFASVGELSGLTIDGYYLESISGFSGLSRVEGSVSLEGLHLQSISGFGALSEVDHLSIGSQSLPSLDGLDALEQVGTGLALYGTWELRDVSALSSLRGIEGQLWIAGASALPNLVGLEGITTLGELKLEYNDALESLEGLNGLTSVSGDASITFNPKLADISALSGLRAVGGAFDLQGNDALATLAGLEGLLTVGDSLIVSNRDLRSLSALSSLRSVGGSLSLGGRSLLSLNGLSGLQSPGGGTWLQDLPSLRSLEGVPTDPGPYLRIQRCTSLADLSGLEGLADYPGDLMIYENDVPSLSGLEGLRSVGGLYIYGEDELVGLEPLDGLKTIGGTLKIWLNGKLAGLDGLGSVEAVGGDLTIEDNACLPAAEAAAFVNGLDSIGGSTSVSGNGGPC
jgi:hypothetical protein